MNLDASPTRDQLRQLLAQHDDRAASHVLWVDSKGTVHLSPLSDGLTESALERLHPDMRVRCETFQKGNEYVGPEAAGDGEWVSSLFDRLMDEWRQAAKVEKVEYMSLDV